MFENSLMSSLQRRQGMYDVSPLSGISGLSFDSTLLSNLLFFCLVMLPFLYAFRLKGSKTDATHGMCLYV